MEDRLVYGKVKSDKNLRCPDCDLGLDGYCVINNIGSTSDCLVGYNYKLIKEEPVKIQPLSKYEWNQIRLENLEIYINSLDLEDSFPDADDKKLIGEVVHLKKYLKENKPTNWQVCTKENTKVGDEVRGIRTKSDFKIMFIFNKSNEAVIRNIDIEDDRSGCLSNYEINTYKDKE